MSDYSWDCYRETLFEDEIQRLMGKKQPGKPLDIDDEITIRYLEKRVKEIKNKYK